MDRFAKTEPTRINESHMAVSALSKKMGYPEMIQQSEEE